MSHPTPESWLDLARRLVPAEKAEPMERHLHEGCQRCRTTLDLWRAVSVLAVREAGFTPSEATIRSAKAMFSFQKLRVSARVLTFAQLVFDSLREPRPAGVRSAAPSTRHLVYNAGRFVVDMRMDLDASQRSVTLVGQVVDSKSPEKRCSNAQVVLMRANIPVVQTCANDFGEFHLEFTQDQEMKLLITVDGDPGIAISLPAVALTRACSRD